MLTQNVCVYLLLVYLIDLCKSCAESYCIENCTRTENLVLGESRILEESVSKNINGVCNQNVKCIGSVLCDLLCYALYYSYVCLNKLKSCLSGLSSDTGRDYNNVGILCISIASRINIAVIKERRCLLDIKSLTESLVCINIDKNDLRCRISCERCVYLREFR